jgi:hypothetical protein
MLIKTLAFLTSTNEFYDNRWNDTLYTAQADGSLTRKIGGTIGFECSIRVCVVE